MSSSSRFKLHKTPLVHRNARHSRYITTTRRPVLSEPGQPYRPSMLVAAPRRVTKAKLAELSERGRARDEAALSDKLTLTQREELDALRNQVAGGSDIPDGSLYNTDEIDTIATENNDAEDGDEWVDDEETAVVEALGLNAVGHSEWENRLKAEQDAWEEQLPELCDAYLEFLGGITRGDGCEDSEAEEQVKIRHISLRSEEIKPFSFVAGKIPGGANIALVRQGFISPSPTRPTIAISLEVLDILAAVQQRCPSASLQGLAKSFCDLRNVPYKTYFRTQLSATLDVYYMIQREAQQRLEKFLHLDSPELKLKKLCPACTNKLKNEPELLYSMLVTCDGNDSLKRCARAAAIDKRNYESDYYISQDEVNKFEDEVGGGRKGKQKSKESEETETECEKRWKNAGADKRPDKKTKNYFEETGVFVTLCRHSFVLTICDMVRSGEKAKYVLASIDRLTSTFGPGILMGYDIGCTTKKTVARSPLIGPKAAKLQFDMCVGSFHGAAHNRACQLQNHPQNRPGAGLSNLENAETFFSCSNRIAASTRLATRFHRHQRIDKLITTWNNDMYEALGPLLRRKYIVALKTIKSATQFISRSSNTVEQIERYFADELQYLDSFKKDLPEDSFKIHYVGLLEQLEAKEDEFNICLNAKPSKAEENSLHRLALFKSCLEAKRRAVLEQLTTLQKAVQRVEEESNIIRWTRDSPEWKEAQRLRDNQHFQLCLDTLEHLVVKRLLEMSRAGLANTGYKLRQQISRSIATRSGAIKTALARYNAAAEGLTPPGQKVTWEQIASTEVLADFDILRGSQRNILDQAWTKPENRRCVEQLHRLQRAHEEVERLNIELLRLHTAIINEEKQLSSDLSKLHATNSPLFVLLQHYVTRRVAVNTMLLRELELTKELSGYSGSEVIGTRPTHSSDYETESTSKESPQLLYCKARDMPTSTDHDTGIDVDDDVVDQFDRWQGVLNQAESS